MTKKRILHLKSIINNISKKKRNITNEFKLIKNDFEKLFIPPQKAQKNFYIRHNLEREAINHQQKVQMIPQL